MDKIGPPGLNIAYILIAFPTITETFNLREMLQLQKFGAHIEIFSLLGPEKSSVVHTEARELAKKTHYGPWFLSRQILSSNLYYLFHSPKRYLRILGLLVSGSLMNPFLLAKTLFIFPKSVHFARIAEKKGVQHIHATFASHNATCAMIMSALTKIPYSVTVDAYDLFEGTALHPEKFSRASFVATISDFNAQLIKKIYGNTVGSHTCLIRRGVDINRYLPKTISDQYKTQGPFQILCVAALRPKKGHRYLLDAINHIKAQGRNIRCVLVGDGPLRKRLAQQIRKLKIHDAVTMVGNQTQEEVLDWLHKADCFVLPSIIAPGNMMEGIPNVLMEAMACGLPVISTNISGIPELVEDHKSGLLVPSEDVEALTEAITSVQDDPTFAMKLGMAGREVVVRDYDLEKNVQKLWYLYMKAIGSA